MADPKFLQYVDDHKDDYIKRLSKAVSIPSYVVCCDKSQVSLVLTSGEQRLGKPWVRKAKPNMPYLSHNS